MSVHDKVSIVVKSTGGPHLLQLYCMLYVLLLPCYSCRKFL
jgi:hypothetical protein